MFGQFLTTFERSLPLKFPSGLDQPDMQEAWSKAISSLLRSNSVTLARSWRRSGFRQSADGRPPLLIAARVLVRAYAKNAWARQEDSWTEKGLAHEHRPLFLATSFLNERERQSVDTFSNNGDHPGPVLRAKMPLT